MSARDDMRRDVGIHVVAAGEERGNHDSGLVEVAQHFTGCRAEHVHESHMDLGAQRCGDPLREVGDQRYARLLAGSVRHQDVGSGERRVAHNAAASGRLPLAGNSSSTVSR